METAKPVLKISVRTLVEFILRYGDINTGFSGSKRAVEGTRIHRKLQKSQKENYDAEVTVKHKVEQQDFDLLIEGRIDGVTEIDGRHCIDEIKSVSEPLRGIHEDYNPLHWAQAKCYAYMFGLNEKVESIDVRLIYCEVESEAVKSFVKQFTFEELASFFNELIEKYLPWARFGFEWIQKRNESLKKLQFPFALYRPGQRELAVAVYRSIENKRNLFAKAPTGTGKTVSTLFPALKAMGEGHTSRIFYLTAKTITRSVAEDTLSLLKSNQGSLKVVTLTAKEKICFKGKSDCNPVSCNYARGHYDRINNAIWDALHGRDDFKREAIEEFATKHKVCPFELCLDISLFCDVIIGDYNYVFDPRVYLKRFFADGGGDFTFLIDEAHNLVDRSRDMFSAQIRISAFNSERKRFKNLHEGLYKKIGKVNSRIRALGKLVDGANKHISKDKDEKLCMVLKNFVEECEKFLVENGGRVDDDTLQLYFDSLVFVKISELFDSRYVLLVEKVEKEITVKLFCVDPSFLLSETLKRGKSAVFFSATLSPLPYYREILGGKPDDPLKTLTSPFDTANRCLLVASDVSTKYQNRENSVDSLVNYLGNIIKHKKGNYLAFFPSYQYMNSVIDLFQKSNPHLNIIVQSSQMTESQREEFLECFKPDPCETVVGFCVLGGLFSEGIDLKSDRLIGAIIVGVGLPQICVERDIIRDYFQSKNGLGYEYAYQYPGMNKVMQAAGRVIRSEEDRGVIVLIDERYTYGTYQNLFPAEWFPHQRVLSHTLDAYVDKFWND